jgi:hypothetical protein
MVPSDAATESLFVAKGNPQNEIASFQAHQPQKLAISNQRANQKSTRDQPFRHSSRPTMKKAGGSRKSLAWRDRSNCPDLSELDRKAFS